MALSWFTATWQTLGLVLASALAIYFSLVVLTRIGGLRSFSKLSAFDFAVTVAIGTVVASTLLSREPPLAQGVMALVALYAIQIGLAMARNRSQRVQRWVDNEPLLLMDHDEILDENLRKGKMTRDDLYAKLREANVLRLEQVRAVVMESTGDVSVLHTDEEGPEPDGELLEGVRGGAER